MPIRKKVDKLNLSQFNTFIERDESLLSNGLFDILDFPEKLTAGKNLFKLRMQSGRFVDGSEVYVEIIDFNGNPIYYQPLKYIEKDGTRVIAIYIYPETSPGPATISVAGRISIDRDGNRIPFSKDPTDENFFNIPNVIWSRSLPVAPFASNTSEIIYTKQPKITITEIVQPYRQPVNIFNIFTEITESAATFTMQPRGTVNPVQINTNLNKEISGDNKVNQNATEQTIFQGQLSKGSSNKNVGKQVSVQQQVQSSLDDTTGKQTTSETVSTISSDSKITFTNFPLSKSMEGGTLTIVNPLINVPQGTLLVDGKVLPSSQANESNASTAGAATLPLSGSYNFTILSVLTKNVAFVAQTSGFKNSNDNTFGAFSIEITSNQSNKSGQASINKNIINSIETSTNVTASFIKPSDVTFTENSASFADIIIADTEPETGDVYRIKTLFKPSGFFGDFIDLGDTILEQQNVLVDTASLETNITIGSFFENFGQFESLQEIEKYWSGSVVGGLATDAVTLSYDVDTLIGGVQITTDWSNGGNAFTAQNNDASIFEIQNKYRPIIHSNTTYILRFSIALPPSITNYKSNDPNIPDSRIDIYCNNNITVDSPIKNISLGTATLPINFTDTLQNDNFKDNGILGTRVGSVLASDIPNLISSVELQFKSLTTEALDLKFVTRRGVFILSDIEILADKETGYTPGYVRLSKRIPTEHLKTPLTFKFQYFDIKGQKADIETFAYGAVFNGGNQYIDGTSNMITGSVFIGNKIGSGIELAGVKSGFMRSVGYQGSIDAASGAGPGGFLIYSGSDALTLGSNTFRGVGVELVGDNDKSHLIFKTEGDGELDIKAEKFFIGTTGSQFISGANSNIEISSSLFHLDPQENLLVIGADAVINADLSANQLFVPAGTTKANARAYISSSGEAGFIGDGAGNYSIILDGRTGQTSTIAGLTASAHSLSTTTYTISSSNNTSDPVSFISSSAFKVSAGGAVTGSSILLGNKAGGNFLQFQSDTLTVQGNITADSISTPSAAAIPSSSISADGLATFRSASIAGFVVNTEEIKSSNESLRLKSGGQITASNVLFTGGEIGGFELSSDEIKSSNNNLKLKDSGQITGSTVLFTGGTVGGFELVSTQINSSNNNLILKDSGQITGSNVLFDGGTIGGFDIASDTISDPGGNLQLTGSSGIIKARAGTIGGFTLTSDKITGNNLIIDSAGILQTADYASDVKGWKLSSINNGFLEVENAKIRGTLSTAVFEKETVNAVGGQLYVANSTTLTSSALHPSDDYLPTDTTMSVVNVTGFAVNEILTLKKVTNTGFSTEYVRIESASRNEPSSENDFSGNIYVIRGYSGSAPTDNTASLGGTAGAPQSYSGSQVIVSTGKRGTGFIRLNANPNDQATPYIDIVERTGSAIYDVQLKARLGDLSGLANSDLVFNQSNPGFGLATDNVFLQGGITATFGTIGGFGITANTISSSNNNLILRDSGQITGSTVLFTGGDIGGFVLSSDEIRSSNNNLRLKANGQITASEAQITGKITATEGTIGGFNIGTNLESSGGTLNLKGSTGQITGSNVLFSGGEIGGFALTATEISSSGLLLKSSGQITGSKVLLEGGRITSDVTIEGSVTANAIRTPATIGGSPSTTANASSSIDAFGFAKFASASIAGFTITDEQIFAEPSRSITGTNVSASFTMTLDSSNNSVVVMDSFATNASYGYKFWSSSLARGTDDAGNTFNEVFVKRIAGSFTNKSFSRGGAFQTEGQINNSNILDNPTDPFDGSLEISLVSGDTVATNATDDESVFCNSDESLLTLVSHSIVVHESPLKLKSSGQITGSNVLFDGGTIGGFDLSATEISSSGLLLKSSGQITGSQVKLTGGDIGGFVLSSDEIRSSNNNLRLKDSGQITASNADLTGKITATSGEIGGTSIGATSLSSTSNLGSPDSNPSFQLDSSGAISGSNLFVRKVTDLGSGNEIVPLLDTRIGLLDGRNLGRQLVSNYDEFIRADVDDGTTFVTVNEHFVQLLPYENTLLISYQLRVDSTGLGTQGAAQFQLQTMTHSGSFSAATNFDNFTDAAVATGTNSVTRTSAGTSLFIAAGALSAKLAVPESAQAQTCRIQVEMRNRMISGLAESPSNKTTLKGYSIIATRQLSANTAGRQGEALNPVEAE